MTRYIIFGIFGLILSFFILITAPDNSKLIDIIGLITFSIGTGFYLKNIKIAGLLTAIGLGVIFHIISAWWYNLTITNDLTIETTFIWILIYTLLTITFVMLLILAIHSVIAVKKTNKINLSNNNLVILTILPSTLMLIEIIFFIAYMK